MDTCFINNTEKSYLLTGSEQGLFLRTLTNGQPGRPALLCNNYSTGLSAVSYHNFLFYAYQTREHALLVRCYPDTPPLFRLTDIPFITYHTPQLVVFSGQLLLFYLTEQQNQLKKLLVETSYQYMMKTLKVSKKLLIFILRNLILIN